MMRYKSIELINYIGIYNGLGLNHIYIDFTRCRNRVIIIRGDNGAGKSTIFKALQVLSDPSEMFIPKLNASKTIEIIDDDTGSLYKIRFEHTYKEKLDGYSTKGYIYKTFDGCTTNLNEQGSITSCKDVIYNELKLDANYIALSQLSNDDKGLASKKPAERKRFASSIIQTTEVYQAIYKTIAKRSSIFKSMINATTSKIEKLGDEKLLSTSLVSIENRIQTTYSRKNQELEALGAQKGIVTQLDPNGSIRETYNTIENIISNLSVERSAIESQITALSKDIGGIEVSEILYDDIKCHKMTTQFSITTLESETLVLLSRREEESSHLQTKIARFNSLQSETNYLATKNMVETCMSKINEYENFFKEMGLRDYNLTHDEYIIGLNTLKDIKDTVDVFKDSISYDIMQLALTEYIANGYYPDRDTLIDAINGLEQCIADNKAKLVYYESALMISKKLTMRHPSCQIDECEFIKDAVSASLEEPEKNIVTLAEEISGTELLLEQHRVELERIEKIIAAMNYFKVLMRNIESYSSILRKLPNGNIFSDKELFTKNLLNGSTFDEINQIYPYITQASIIEDYGNTVKLIESLKADIQIYETKNDLIEEIQQDIKDLNDKISQLSITINSNKNKQFELERELDEYTSKENIIKTLLALYDDRKRINMEIIENQNNLKALETSMSVIQNALIQIDVITNRILSIDNELKVLEKDKSELEHSLRLLSEYKEEMNIYSSKFEKIEAIKFYSSYNTGIQTTFMELYMYQVNQIANQLMSYVLDGRFHFKRWIINEDEFRIPCLGDGGYLNDDISSLSGGELAIVSTIIGFSLLFQASTKYNILKLDEVDATLDSTNRRQFVVALEQLMEILRCNQLFMISHNDEFSMDNADVILLRVNDANKYNEILSVGNIIYNYREEVG